MRKLAAALTLALVLAAPPPASANRTLDDAWNAIKEEWEYRPFALFFALPAFIGSRDDYGTVLHEINVAVERAFRKADIEIAFPQQDLHIRTVNGLSVFAPPTVEGLRKAA